MKEKLKAEWTLYPLQIVGAGLLIPAFILAVMATRAENDLMIYLAWSVLGIIGAIDLYIIWEAKREEVEVITITHWVRGLLPKRWDNVIMFAFFALIWWLMGPLIALWYAHGFLNDHFNEDR